MMPGVAGGTGGADRVVRAGDAQVERDLAGRIVGHGARVVVVRPELGVVVEALELVDFVFGLDVAVLGDADVDADRRLVDVGPIEPGVGDGLVGAVDADAAGPGAAAQFLLLLIAQLVEVADAGHGRADVANLVGRDAAAAGQQALAKLGQIVAVGGGQANAGDHDPIALVASPAIIAGLP